MTSPSSRPRRTRGPRLVFAPLAFLKLLYCCHAGDTEVGGFAITAKDDPLYIEEFVTVRQKTSLATVEFDDDAVADFQEQCVDRGLAHQHFMRIWLHTHPGASAEPSGTDEDTFARVFGRCDWAVMFILSRTQETYARLSFHVGPGAAVQIPVSVDWRAWPALASAPAFSLGEVVAAWQKEFAANIVRVSENLRLFAPPQPVPDAALELTPEPTLEMWEWPIFDHQLWEEYESYERNLNHDRRA